MDWEEQNTEVYEILYESAVSTLLYIEDTYRIENPTPQTTIDDFHEPRYEAKVHKWMRHEPDTLKESFDYDEVEEFVEGIVNL